MTKKATIDRDQCDQVHDPMTIKALYIHPTQIALVCFVFCFYLFCFVLLLPHQGLFCIWNRRLSLPNHWTCTYPLAFSLLIWTYPHPPPPPPNNQTLAFPLVAHIWPKRDIQFIPLLIGLGIMAGIGGIAS